MQADHGTVLSDDPNNARLAGKAYLGNVYAVAERLLGKVK